ncbi:hypothetical protein WJX72_006220 [[Myrmecia] bisecta]|uniref:Uncharacterized protein n=1 Tax=[Myrmecia] bisecta TaxID=41462 RepID=A0AAW1QFD4_9CHLO
MLPAVFGGETKARKIDTQIPLPRINLSELGEKEESRKFRRTVFTQENWVVHRRKDRYARHMLGVLTSRIVRELAKPLLIVAGISILVCSLETIRELGILPKDWPSLSVQVGEPFKLASFALSLLLVFRTDTSYARWLDARKAWDTILVGSRDFVRQGLTCLDTEEDGLRSMLQRWTVAFMRTTKVHFRPDDDLREDLESVLLPEELKQLLQADHKPNFVLQVLGAIVCRLNTQSDATLALLNEHLRAFAEALGTCERISSTPIPLMFTRHTSRCLVIYLTFLPLALWDQCRWASIPSSVVIAFLLLGIDEIGVQIESPLDLLPLDTICNMGEANIEEMMGSQAKD